MNLLKQTLSEFSEDRCTTLAAALAYYTAFALAPLLFLLMMVLTFGLSVAYESEKAESKAQSVIEKQASQMIGNESISDEVSAILRQNQQASGKWWKTLLSFIGIVIGATGAVAALQDALNQVWQVKPDPEKAALKDLLKKRLLSLVMILGFGLLLLLSLILSTVLAAIGDQLTEWIGINVSAAYWINFLIQALILLVVFGSIFKFMPDAQIEWRDVFVGTVVTTILFLVGRYALQLYFTYASPGAELGAAAASIAILLVWIYYNANILLLGAEAAQVYAVRHGKGIVPNKGAVRVIETLERVGKSEAA